MPDITTPPKRYTFEVIPDMWGGYRYRFCETRETDGQVTRSAILVSDHGDKRVGVTAHMLVLTKTPGDTKHTFRVDDPIPINVARHIVGHWVTLAEHPDPVPFPVGERSVRERSI